MAPAKRTARDAPLQRQLAEERRATYRRTIVDAAERVFAQKGSDRSRMSEVAEEAGISLGTLYDVIGGKESLLSGVHAARLSEFLGCISEARDAHDDTLASHLAVLRDGARYFLEHPEFLRMCCRDGYGWASAFRRSPQGGEFWSESTSIPRDLFARGIAEGIYVDEDPDLLVRKMLALKQVELLHWVETGMEEPHEAVVDRLERQFLRAFRRCDD